MNFIKLLPILFLGLPGSGKCRSVEQQLLPAIPGYVPVYIQTGNVPPDVEALYQARKVAEEEGDQAMAGTDEVAAIVDPVHGDPMKKPQQEEQSKKKQQEIKKVDEQKKKKVEEEDILNQQKIKKPDEELISSKPVTSENTAAVVKVVEEEKKEKDSLSAAAAAEKKPNEEDVNSGELAKKKDEQAAVSSRSDSKLKDIPQYQVKETLVE